MTKMKLTLLILAAVGLVSAAPSKDLHKVNGTYPFRPTIGGRIIGGIDADINDVPYVAALIWGITTHVCGGVIIAPRVVLTAAHCVAPSVISDIDQLNVRSGTRDRGYGGLRVSVSRIIIHELYEDCAGCSPDYDIAVLHLESNVVARGVTAEAISLWPAATEFYPGILGTVSGWGQTTEHNTGTIYLQRVELPVVSKQNCQIVYGPSVISRRTICAGFAAGGSDACSGDSGGPFVIENKLAGLVSFGAGCAQPGIPGVYSSIPGYRAWINRHAGV